MVEERRELDGVRRRNGTGPRVVRCACTAVTLTMTCIAIARSVPPPAAGLPRLELMSRDDLTAALMRGSGCSFALRGDNGARFTMAEDKAAAKIAGRIVKFRKAAGARHLFPFTFDRWQADGLGVSVRQHGQARMLGEEGAITPAVLVLQQGTVRRSIAGELSCGS